MPVRVAGVTDPEGDPFTLRMASLYRDESVDKTGDGRFAPDGQIYPTRVRLRAERDGRGNGRVYYVLFVASDDFAPVQRSIREQAKNSLLPLLLKRCLHPPPG